MSADLPPNLEELPAEGVVSCFKAKTFLHLVLLCHSVREIYPVPVVCFDAGLSTDQRVWIAENLPSCTVLSVPEEATPSSDGSLRRPLIAASPFRRTCWIDPGLVLLGGIGELFTRLDYGPVVVGAAAVSGLDVERDADLLELPSVLDDHGPGEGPWTIPFVPSEALPGVCFREVHELFEELRRALPDVHAVRLSGEWPEPDPFLLSVSARTPGRPRPRSGEPRSAVHLMSMIGAKSSPELVEAFLDHYYRLGVESFLIALHSETGDPRSDRILQILRRYQVEPLLVTPVFSAARKLRFYEQTALERCSPQDWILYADVDELQVFPTPLAEVLETCDELGYTFVRGELLDRVAGGGELIEIDPRLPVWEQFPFTAFATGRLTAGWTGKVCAAKGWVRLGEGGAHTLDYGSDDPRNYVRTQRDPRRYPHAVEVHHFKWDAELARRTYEKIHALGGDLDSVDGPGFMPEYTALLEHLDRFGRLAIDDLTFAGTPELHYVRSSLYGLSLSAEASQGQTPTVEGARRASPKRSLRSSPHPGPPPDRSYLLCTSPRTGSNFLCELLARTGEAGFPGEYFFEGGEEINCRWWGIEPGHAYLEEVVRRSTSENGVVGTKVMWPHLATLVARLRASADTPEATDLEALAYLLPSPRFIWLRREDTIAQAVSWARAVQTGQWLPQQKPANKPVFDYELIRFFAGRASVVEDEWRRWFERHEIAPFRISHEELLADVGGSIGRILEFLEIPVPADLSAGSELTSRQQRDDINREWTIRYHEMETARRRPKAIAAGDSADRPAGPPAVHACTVLTRNRLAHARVLARSFLEHHPGGRITALLVDDVDREIDAAAEPFDIAHPEDTGLDRRELHRMATMYSAYELASSLKPWVIGHVLGSGAPAVLYLDSDIWVAASLRELSSLVTRHGLVLTPHVTEPPPNPYEEPWRLIGGTVQAGFLGVGPDALPFVDWFRDRLSRGCRLAPEAGFWTDQRWVDLARGYFPNHVLRDPGYNVATWNLSTRRLELTATGYRVNGSPLRFFHFARFDPTTPHVLDRSVTHVRLSREPAVAELCRMYSMALAEQGQAACAGVAYGFDALPDGPRLDRTMRRIYREAVLEAERGNGMEPPNPFSDGPMPFLAWLSEPGGPQPHASSRYLEAAKSDGVDESSVPPELLPRPRSTPTTAPPEPEAYLPGVNLLLRVGRASRLDDVGRRLAACLAEAEIPFTTVWWNEIPSEDHSPFVGLHAAAAPYGTTIACLNPLDIGAFAYFVTPAFFSGRTTIGVWLDEELPAPDLDHAIGFLKEIWVASEFASQGLATRTEKPVAVLPIPIETSAQAVERGPLEFPERFLFLALGDFGSPNVRGWYERQNPLAAIRAFTQAVEPTDGAALLVRTTGGEDHIVDLEELLMETSRSDVRVIDGPLAAEERSALIASCDCLVSLHRAEEFGIAMAEAAACGKPIVATGFSGNLSFLDSESAYLVAWEPAEIAVEEPSYWEQEVWAEPDLEHAAAQIRAVLDDPAEAHRRAVRARRVIAERFSVRATAGFLRRRLAEIQQPRVQGQSDAAPETSADQPTSPLQLAGAYVAHGPLNSWDAPSRFGPAGRLARRLLIRALRPYAARHGEFDAAVAAALSDLNHRTVQIERQLEELMDLVQHVKRSTSRSQ